mmetsp:Transcript_6906/g.9744  ORF Transcript_6906/g.9744 Transcript_6906/m.9744 type:complete len:672 (-) Transcript_6906:47-2062(-)
MLFLLLITLLVVVVSSTMMGSCSRIGVSAATLSNRSSNSDKARLFASQIFSRRHGWHNRIPIASSSSSSTTIGLLQTTQSRRLTAFVPSFATAGQAKREIPSWFTVSQLIQHQQRQQRQQQRFVSTSNIQEEEEESLASNRFDEEDTIFAVSSGASLSSSQATAVAVIRLTGPQSHNVLQTLITPQQSIPPLRKACVRTLYDPKDNTPLDQPLVLVFQKPYSFTGEDLVELHCHGSRAVLQGVLEALGSIAPKNVRYAERGEFTSRAFSNGKLDLLEVEALADLLTADTQKQRQQALKQLEGHLSSLYNNWREMLISGLAHAEAVIDFGDDEHLDDDVGEEFDDNFNYDAAQMNVWGNVGTKMADLCVQMEQHLQDANRGELVREGVKIAIVGPPNAGKSSLFNMLAKRDAAIVSPIAGTTRDVLELTLDLGGVRCTLSDTAGVREESSTDDIIEVEGMKRARNVASQANIVVAMMDATDMTRGNAVLTDVLEHSSSVSLDNEDDDDQPQHLDTNDVLVVMNKMDLLSDAAQANDETTTTAIDESASSLPTTIGGKYGISCETNDGVDVFLDALTDKVLAKVSSPSTTTNGNSGDSATEGALITRARHRQHVKDAVDALHRFDSLSKQGYMALDMAAEELRLAASELGRITGAVDVEDVLDVLFSDFCIGK